MKKPLLALFAVFTAIAPLNAKSFSGYSEPSQIIDLALPESGVLAQINIKEGETAEPGQKLASLDNSLYEIELEIAQEKLRHQNRRMEKLEALRENDQLSIGEYEQAKTDIEVLKLNVKRLEAQIERRTLRSNIHGVVSEIHKHAAEGVANSESKIITLVQTSTLVVNLFIDFDLAMQLNKGDLVPIRFENGAFSPDAEIVYIAPTIDKASKTIRLKLSIENSDGKFLSGMLGTIELPGYSA